LHYDADSLSRTISNVGAEKEGRVALDGIVRMVDAFFRHWDDAEKMWSEYERGGFRLVVIDDELPLFRHSIWSGTSRRFLSSPAALSSWS
jgi:hypothetical protein